MLWIKGKSLIGFWQNENNLPAVFTCEAYIYDRAPLLFWPLLSPVSLRSTPLQEPYHTASQRFVSLIYLISSIPLSIMTY